MKTTTIIIIIIAFVICIISIISIIGGGLYYKSKVYDSTNVQLSNVQLSNEQQPESNVQQPESNAQPSNEQPSVHEITYPSQTTKPVVCKTDDSGWNPITVQVGQSTSKTCDSGIGIQTATCNADKSWSFDTSKCVNPADSNIWACQTKDNVIHASLTNLKKDNVGNEKTGATWACNNWNNDCKTTTGGCTARNVYNCLRDNKYVADVSVDWGYDISAATYACNTWVGECGNKCTARGGDGINLSNPNVGDAIRWQGNNGNNDFCLAVQDGVNNKNYNREVNNSPCNTNDPNQVFYRDGNLIRWKYNNSKCLVSKGYKGDSVETTDCDPTHTDQTWYFDNGLIRNYGHNNQCITVYTGGGNNAKIITWDCDRNDKNQIFYPKGNS